MDTLPLGPNPLNRWLSHRREHIRQEKQVAKIVMEAGIDAPSQPSATLPGDARRLRGIPAIGRNVGGAIPGTRPDKIVA